MRRQATGLVPLGGFTVAGQRRVHTGLRCGSTIPTHEDGDTLSVGRDPHHLQD